MLLIDSISDLAERRPFIIQFMRFACIGLMNTALDFLLFNAISKALEITQGIPLGGVAFFSFSMAVIQSYLWNRTWTFGSETATLRQNIPRLIMVGALGGLTIVAAVGGSVYSLPAAYFVGILAVYLFIETVLWRHFGFHLSDWNHESHSFLVFFIVTFIGLMINSSLVAFVSTYLHLTPIVDLNKNIAKVIATGVSLFWNFSGYKFIVFRKLQK